MLERRADAIPRTIDNFSGGHLILERESHRNTMQAAEFIPRKLSNYFHGRVCLTDELLTSRGQLHFVFS